jgi:hypothetical protein
MKAKDLAALAALGIGGAYLYNRNKKSDDEAPAASLKSRDFDAVDPEDQMPAYQGRTADRLADIQNEYGSSTNAATKGDKRSDADDFKSMRMPTRPGQKTSGMVKRPATPVAAPVAAPETPAGNPKLNSLRETKPRNFDPAYKSSEIISSRTQDTLDKQLKKAPTENAGRMAAQQRLATKAANTANSQAIIDRMSRRTRPYMTDEAGNDMKRGGAVKKMASGGTASSRGDGIAQRGKTRGKMY